MFSSDAGDAMVDALAELGRPDLAGSPRRRT
jgi:hypothetical protein